MADRQERTMTIELDSSEWGTWQTIAPFYSQHDPETLLRMVVRFGLQRAYEEMEKERDQAGKDALREELTQRQKKAASGDDEIPF